MYISCRFLLIIIINICFIINYYNCNIETITNDNLSSNIPGGPVIINPYDPEVQKAFYFALNINCPNNICTGYVYFATVQVVNGLLYNLDVAILYPNTPCVMKRFTIWKRAAPPALFLIHNFNLDYPCPLIESNKPIDNTPTYSIKHHYLRN